MTDKLFQIGVVGASGYTGIELIRILLAHPAVEIKAISSRQFMSKSLCNVYPYLTQSDKLCFVSPDPSNFDGCDVVFFATPHGVAMQYANSMLDQGSKVIDLSADFRIKNIAIWQDYYKMPHVASDLVKESVYGLPELFRNEIAGARLIANPGCYPTAVLLGLLPLLRTGVSCKKIIVDACSGVSGAGKTLRDDLLFCEANEDFRSYALPNRHRHYPEIQQMILAVTAWKEVNLTFIPHLLPLNCGMHATIHAATEEEIDLPNHYKTFYQNEPFIHVLDKGKLPAVKMVRSSNNCFLAVHPGGTSKEWVMLSVIDNLQKGAAAQAVQNMNILLRLPETQGLNPRTSSW